MRLRSTCLLVGLVLLAMGSTARRLFAKNDLPIQLIGGVIDEATGALDTYCETCGDAGTCDSCDRSELRFFADFLYLRPGNADIVYAIESTGSDPAFSLPTGQVGSAAPDTSPGFRIGFGIPVAEAGQINATYTWFESDTASSVNALPGTVLVSDVFHPNGAISGTNSLFSEATYDIGFQLMDLDYRTPLASGCLGELAFVAGVRYAHLNQDFASRQLTGVATGLTSLSTDIGFDGFGIRLGLAAEKQSARTGLLVYGSGMANFVAGEFKAGYRQTSQFGGTAVIANSFEDFRTLSILELEIGVGWQTAHGLRFTAGYMVNAWFNTLTTAEYIDGVHTNNFSNLGETLTFDGLALRAEMRF